MRKQNNDFREDHKLNLRGQNKDFWDQKSVLSLPNFQEEVQENMANGFFCDGRSTEENLRILVVGRQKPTLNTNQSTG